MSLDTSDELVLVTGATSGLGRAVAKALAEQGRRVLVHGRDAKRVGKVADEVGAAGRYVADLASLAQVRELAERVATDHGALQVLINNAGVGAGRPPFRKRELSVDGHELRFAVNYLAPVLLARLLVPALVASTNSQAPARVVNVGSVGQSPVELDDLRMDRRYTGIEAYNRSKFALAAASIDLAGELAGTGVTVHCLHPASLMNTRMVRQALVPPMATVASGVRAVLNLAVGPVGGASTGGYFDGTSPARAHPGVYDPATRAALRTATDPLLAPFLAPAA